MYSLWTVVRSRSTQHNHMSRFIVAEEARDCYLTRDWTTAFRQPVSSHTFLSGKRGSQSHQRVSSSFLWKSFLFHCSSCNSEVQHSGTDWKGKKEAKATKFTFKKYLLSELCLLTLLTCQKALHCCHGNTEYCAEQVHLYCISTLCFIILAYPCWNVSMAYCVYVRGCACVCVCVCVCACVCMCVHVLHGFVWLLWGKSHLRETDTEIFYTPVSVSSINHHWIHVSNHNTTLSSAQQQQQWRWWWWWWALWQVNIIHSTEGGNLFWPPFVPHLQQAE